MTRGESLHALQTRNGLATNPTGYEGIASCGCTWVGNTFTISDACRAEIAAAWAKAMDPVANWTPQARSRRRDIRRRRLNHEEDDLA